MRSTPPVKYYKKKRINNGIFVSKIRIYIYICNKTKTN